MRKGSPGCRVRVGCPWIIISTVPARMYPTSSPGCMCQPDSTPTGISVSTCTISRPGIEEVRCWSSVRLSLAASASAGCCGLVSGAEDMTGPLDSGGNAGGNAAAQERQQLCVDLPGGGDAHDVRASLDF